MPTIIDRRGEHRGKFYSSRDRFLDRNKRKVRKAIEKKIAGSGIKDMGKGGVDVTVPKDDISEPVIYHGQGGVQRKVLPGNKKYNAGDIENKPPGGGGGGGVGDGDPGKDGEAEDEFVFNLSEEEFLSILYEDLELPNLTKKDASDVKEMKYKRAGFVTSGPPNKMDLARSKQSQLMRHAVFKKPLDKKILEALKKQQDILREYDPSAKPEDFEKLDQAREKAPMKLKLKALRGDVETLREAFQGIVSADDAQALSDLDESIKALEKKKTMIPAWNESTDLKFRHHDPKPVPSAKAVMFCLMDVSASMGEVEKNNAKLFYWLLQNFLQRNYDQVDTVFIRHTGDAEEVDEQTFFYDRKTGGTVVSSSLEKMEEIIKERYDATWNIYGAQATDGENSPNDNEYCVELLMNLLPQMQAYFYTEISETGSNSWSQDFWDTYDQLATRFAGKMFMGKITERKDIWPLFRDFFSGKESYDAKPSAMHASRWQPALP